MSEQPVRDGLQPDGSWIIDAERDPWADAPPIAKAWWRGVLRGPRGIGRFDALTGELVTGDEQMLFDWHYVRERLRFLFSGGAFGGQHQIEQLHNVLRDLEWLGYRVEVGKAWDESEHPRGKTTEESTPGSFRPADGGGEPDAVEQARTESELRAVRQRIAERIGTIERGEDATEWRNRAITNEGLYADALDMEPTLRAIVMNAATQGPGRVNFGPTGQEAVKTLESLRAKVAGRVEKFGTSTATEVGKISDAVRGSLIVELPEEVAPATRELTRAVQAAGGRMSWDNKFTADNPFGYGAVHGDALLPLPEGGWMRAEIQVHLGEINSGTWTSTKERAHDLYKKGGGTPTALTQSRRMYLSAYQRVLAKEARP